MSSCPITITRVDGRTNAESSAIEFSLDYDPESGHIQIRCGDTYNPDFWLEMHLKLEK